MRRRATSATAKAKAKRPVARQSRKTEGARVADLEARLAGALAREAAALEEQTATAEILRVISGSPADLRPVFDAVARSATRLCDAFDAVIFHLDGDRLRLVAHHGPIPAGPVGEFSLPLARGTAAGRSVLEGRTVHVADMQAESADFPEGSENARRMGHRTVLSVPLMRQGVAIGVIHLRRTDALLFAERQVALLQTFAAQAVIAVENARLFTELQEKNRALGQAHAQVIEALEQGTATGEILGVISRSPTDVQPVFDAIAAKALDLCRAKSGAVFRLEGGRLHVAAAHSFSQEALESLRQTYPIPLSRVAATARAVLSRTIVHIPDIREDPEYGHQAVARAAGYLSVLAVPMLHEGEPIGAIGVVGADAGAFSQRQIELLKTFADQAVIAIENVRLFQELEARNRELAEALGQQTATAEILRVISSSPTDLQPVVDTIVARAVSLCGGRFGALYRVEGGLVDVAATCNITPGILERFRRAFPARPHRGLLAMRAILDGRVAHETDVEADPAFANREMTRAIGIRSLVAVPMMREGTAIGAIAVGRSAVGPFPAGQIGLLKTFADQAVIALQNVRLFQELQARNRDLTEALEQQTATSEVLKVISRSTFDLQPVLETLVENATRLCGAEGGLIARFDGEVFRMVAEYGASPAFSAYWRRNVIRPGRGSVTARAALERRTVHVVDVLADPEYDLHDAQRVGGYRSVLCVPMQREDDLVGLFVMWRTEVRAFTDKQIGLVTTFADQAVIAIENVRLLQELQARNAELTEALEQQTATADILRVISSSPTDLQPVMEAVAENAARVCGATDSSIFRLEGEHLRLVARHGSLRRSLTIGDTIPVSGTVGGRVVGDRRTIQVEDIMAAEAEFPVTVSRNRQAGSLTRTILGTPLLREGAALGVIVINGGPAVHPFSTKQIALLETFATQAVIAIENVRLFQEVQARNRELTEALEQQTATAEILRVISSSPTDVQPVFDTIARSAAQLCDGDAGAVIRFDGELAHLVAAYDIAPERLAVLAQRYPLPVSRAMALPRAIVDRAIVHIPDTRQDPDYDQDYVARTGSQGLVAVPLLREGRPIGAIAVSRAQTGPFSANQIRLVQTFADQAVIAVENVRLFQEVQARNRALTESLEQQTATADILRVIASSPTDLQPVMEAVAENAARVCGATDSSIFRLEGGRLRVVARHGSLRRALTIGDTVPVSRDIVVGRAVGDRRTVHVEDILAAAAEFPVTASRRRETESLVRTMVATPLLREGMPLGVIFIARGPEAQPFSAKQIALLETFAHQAVIAIENVRLFNELRARTAELTRSVAQLTALGEVSRAVSSTLDVEAVLDTIVSRASQLAGADGCSIYEYDEGTEQFHLRATHDLDPAYVEAIRTVPLRKGEGLMGRATELREPVQIPDITRPEAYQSRVRDALVRFGYRALLSVPLWREDQIIGSLSLNRKAPGAFPPEVIDVLKTFATQSALALQNARLFREIADQSRQLEAASRHKSEFLANMSHELRTPLNAIIGFSEVLAERMFGEVNAKQAEYLQDILASGRHLLSLINDILDLSKVEAGRLELDLGRFHLPTALDGALTLVRERATRHGITLRQAVDPQVGEIVADERKVKQVLLNLLSNAVKFTPEGGRVDLTATAAEGVVSIAVRDTGIGIAPEDQAAIFEEFRQVGRSDGRQREGTGLGLTLARKFVELHGGRISVRSQVGQGSTFTFTLPVRPDGTPSR